MNLNFEPFLNYSFLALLFGVFSSAVSLYFAKILLDKPLNTVSNDTNRPKKIFDKKSQKYSTKETVQKSTQQRSKHKKLSPEKEKVSESGSSPDNVSSPEIIDPNLTSISLCNKNNVKVKSVASAKAIDSIHCNNLINNKLNVNYLKEFPSQAIDSENLLEEPFRQIKPKSKKSEILESKIEKNKAVESNQTTISIPQPETTTKTSSDNINMRADKSVADNKIFEEFNIRFKENKAFIEKQKDEISTLKISIRKEKEEKLEQISLCQDLRKTNIDLSDRKKALEERIKKMEEEYLASRKTIRDLEVNMMQLKTSHDNSNNLKVSASIREKALLEEGYQKNLSLLRDELDSCQSNLVNFEKNYKLLKEKYMLAESNCDKMKKEIESKENDLTAIKINYQSLSENYSEISDQLKLAKESLFEAETLISHKESIVTETDTLPISNFDSAKADNLINQKELENQLESSINDNKILREKNEILTKQIAELESINSKKHEELIKRNDSLQLKLNDSVRALANTDKLLTSLEQSVEEEENKWRTALSSSELECDKLRGELMRIFFELKRSNSGPEMNSKISELCYQLESNTSLADHISTNE